MNWYVIQTKPKKEEEATSYLTLKGVDIFGPKMDAFSLRSGKMVKGLQPLFPGYLFGKFDLEQDYSLVRWGRGVKRILGFGGYSTPVSEEVMEIIKNRVDSNGVVRKKADFKPNDLV